MTRQKMKVIYCLWPMAHPDGVVALPDVMDDIMV